jgi:uncharacterized protein YggU (UPF0235/DUF167 family)
MLKVAVRVTPRASRARLVAEGAGLHAWVTAPPADGRANEALRRLVARALDVPLVEVQILSGERGRDKVLLVPDAVADRLRSLPGSSGFVARARGGAR